MVLETIVSKRTYPASAEVDREWKQAVKLNSLEPGKYGAITIKVGK